MTVNSDEAHFMAFNATLCAKVLEKTMVVPPDVRAKMLRKVGVLIGDMAVFVGEVAQTCECGNIAALRSKVVEAAELLESVEWHASDLESFMRLFPTFREIGTIFDHLARLHLVGA